MATWATMADAEKASADRSRREKNEKARKLRNRQTACSRHFQKLVQEHRDFKKAYDLAEELWGDMLTNRLPGELGHEKCSLLIRTGFAFLTVANEIALSDFGEDQIHPQPFTEDP